MTVDDYIQLGYRWAQANGTNFSISRIFLEWSAKEQFEFVKNCLLSKAQHFIVNPELFVRNPDEFLHINCGGKIVHIDGMIVDESAIMKNPNSAITKTITNYSSNMKYLYLLSGKPAPNTILEYYPQINAVAPELFSYSFRKAQNLMWGVGTVPRRFKNEFLEAVGMASITVSKQDCFDLPPTTNIIRQIQLEAEVMEQYQSMKWLLYADIQSIDEQEKNLNNKILVNTIFACITKLRQIASGFIIEGKEVLRIHNQKLKELMLIIEELGDSQALIWCQFRYEIELIETTLRKHGYSVATAYSRTKDKDESINMFKRKQVQFLVAHPRTLQYGVTLTNCNYSIYYSTSYSFEEYYQSHDRIYRFGQSLPCTYIFIQCEDTIDEIMYDVIQNKKSRIEMVEMVLKHLEDCNSKYNNNNVYVDVLHFTQLQ